VEIEVRDAGGYPEKEIGKTLMFKAFAPGGPLAKASDDKSDCDALAGLFAGALNRFRNPGAHTRRTFQDALEAMEELMLASRLHGGDLGQSVETGGLQIHWRLPAFRC
jgi:hypothetical protein